MPYSQELKCKECYDDGRIFYWLVERVDEVEGLSKQFQAICDAKGCESGNRFLFNKEGKEFKHHPPLWSIVLENHDRTNILTTVNSHDMKRRYEILGIPYKEFSNRETQLFVERIQSMRPRMTAEDQPEQIIADP